MWKLSDEVNHYTELVSSIFNLQRKNLNTLICNF